MNEQESMQDQENQSESIAPQISKKE